MAKVIGIDLGTTNSVVAVMEGGEPTVIASAEDPNDLDAFYAQLVGSLAEGSVTHVVVSPSACYSGLPSRYDGKYVLGVWHDTRDAVRAMLDPSGARPGWIGAVASTCVD